ncbi:hypothetical protein HY041_02850, partial [Candidatus Roizmanbacteria bacterium]|nr:hypothetical protein [Candidatus Roizmanbacteria bacterium]
VAAVSLLPCSMLYYFLTQKLLKADSSRYDYWIQRHPPDKSARSIALLESLMTYNQGNTVTHLEEVFRAGLQHEIAFFSQFDDLIE